MGLVNPAQISDGTGVDAADVNNPINTIADEINGNLDANNLASNAVTTAKIADDAVTGAKIASYYVPTQNDNADAISNVTSNTAIIQAGWVQAVGNNTDNLGITITFPVAFSTIYSITGSFIGVKATSAAATIAELIGAAAGDAIAVHFSTPGTTTVSLTGVRESGATFASGNYWGFSWIAVGAP